jgi:hypothetical protein
MIVVENLTKTIGGQNEFSVVSFLPQPRQYQQEDTRSLESAKECRYSGEMSASVVLREFLTLLYQPSLIYPG